MKSRRLAGIIAIMTVVSLSGCSLAIPDAGQAGGSDRLIGALITSDYLDLYDIDAYLNDHAWELNDKKEITVSDEAKYNERLYAEIDKSKGKDPDDWEITFGDVSGIRFFSPEWTDENGEKFWGSVGDEGICDMETDIKTSDTGEEEHSLKGTVYMLQGQADKDVAYYTNPVYQTPDGKIYVVSGSGFSTSGESGEGEHMSTTLSGEITMTENGKSKIEKSNVTVSLRTMYEPVKITLYQMDEKNRIIKKEEYEPGKLPGKIIAEKETEYILVETEKKKISGGKAITREIYDDREGENMLETFHALENGIIAKQETEILWDNAM